MSRIRGINTNLEKKITHELDKKKVKYTFQPKMMGKPDVVLKNIHKIVFIDSCFWHGCPQHGKIPKVRRKFWKEKIERNIERDRQITSYYEGSKWNVIRIWEHEIKKDFEEIINKVLH